MNTEQAKKYADERYAELTDFDPDMSREDKVNLIIAELSSEQDFIVTAPLTGLPVEGIVEDQGLIFKVTNLIR